MLGTLAISPMFPPWLVLPLAGIAFATIGGHLMALSRSSMQRRRRRIRTANAMVLLGLTALITYAVGFVDMLPSGGGSIGHVRAFVLVWMTIMGLVPVVLALAAMDVMNTIQMNREAAKELRRRLQMDAIRDVQIHIKARLKAPSGATGGDQRDG